MLVEGEGDHLALSSESADGQMIDGSASVPIAPSNHPKALILDDPDDQLFFSRRVHLSFTGRVVLRMFPHLRPRGLD